MGISTPCSITTTQNVIPKFGTHNYVWDITHTQILGQIGLAKVLPIYMYVKYNTFVTFLTVLVFFSILSTYQTVALVYTLHVSNNVGQEGACLGLERRVMPFGGNMPKKWA